MTRTVTLRGKTYTEASLTCPEPGCGSPMQLRYSGKFKTPVFYGCCAFPNCRATHGAHPDGRPLGVPATAEVKQARIAAHDAFDLLWKGGSMRRSQAYKWLTDAMGREWHVHIGELGIEDCRRVVEVVEAYWREHRPMTTRVENGGGG